MIPLLQLSLLLVLLILISVFIAGVMPLNYWIITAGLLIGATIIIPVSLEWIFKISELNSSRIFFSLVVINFIYSIFLTIKGFRERDKKTIICGAGEFSTAALYIFLFLTAEMLNSV